MLSPALFADAPQGKFSLNRMFDRAIEAGRLHGLRLEGTWMHVGTPAAIAAAESDGERGLAASFQGACQTSIDLAFAFARYGSWPWIEPRLCRPE